MPPPKNKSKKPTSTPSSSTSTSSSSHPPPNWPPFHFLPSPTDLSLHPLLPDQILTISGFWPAKLCKEYVHFLSGLPLTTTPGKPKKGDAVRVNDRFQIDDAAFAERLWSETSLKALVLDLDDDERKSLWGGEVLGLNPNIRIYRYSKGQFFDQHYDDSNLVSLPPTSSTSTSNSSSPIKARTTWTLLLYLTSPTTGCLGGETVFYPDPVPMPPPSKAKKGGVVSGASTADGPVVVELEVGMALLHRHGKECMLHEGREVLAGEKWVIRSDLCVRR